MKFRDLMLRLADQIGRHHLPVVDDAHEIGEFLGDDAIHHELVKRVVRSVYRANRCGHLNAQISANPTFDAIGKIRGELFRSNETDIEAIRLMDQIGDLVSQSFMQAESKIADRPCDSPSTRSPSTSTGDADNSSDGRGAVHKFSAGGTARIER